MKILLAVDGSAYTKKMLAYLAAHEGLLGVNHSYTILTVQAPLPPRVRSAVDKNIVDGYYSDETGKVLSPVVRFLARHSIKATQAWKVGHAGDSIANYATAGGFDLVVMGSHGHGALGNLVMGSVATQVIANCKVPVLLVR